LFDFFGFFKIRESGNNPGKPEKLPGFGGNQKITKKSPKFRRNIRNIPGFLQNSWDVAEIPGAPNTAVARP